MVSEATIDISVSAKFHDEMEVLEYTASDDKWEETFDSGDGVGPDAVTAWLHAWGSPPKRNKSKVVVRLTPAAARFLLWDFDSARFDIWEDDEQHGFLRTGRRVRAELRAWLERLGPSGPARESEGEHDY